MPQASNPALYGSRKDFKQRFIHANFVYGWFAILMLSVRAYFRPSMRGSRNFRHGGPGQSDKKKANVFFVLFLVLSLFYRSQMVNFEEIYHFSRFQRGSNIFQGGGGSNVSQGCPIAYSL